MVLTPVITRLIVRSRDTLDIVQSTFGSRPEAINLFRYVSPRFTTTDNQGIVKPSLSITGLMFPDEDNERPHRI